MRKILLSIFILFGFGLFLQTVMAGVSNVGDWYYTHNNANDRISVTEQTATTPGVGLAYAKSTVSSDASVSSGNWVIAKQNPAGTERTLGILYRTGHLAIFRCSTFASQDTCTHEWTVTSVTPLQTCGTSNVYCSRPFDIEYEQESGRALVVYARHPVAALAPATDATNLFYCYRSTTSWGPATSCQPNYGTNNLDVSTGLATTVRWVSLKGGQTKYYGRITNRILVAYASGGTTGTGGASIWNGPTNAWVSTTTVKQLSASCNSGQCLDGDWSGSTGTAILAWGRRPDTSIGFMQYDTVNGWYTRTHATSTPLGAAAQWVMVEGNHRVNSVAVAVETTLPSGEFYIIKPDNRTVTSTAIAGSGTESNIGRHVSVAWRKRVLVNDSEAFFTLTSANCLTPGYRTWNIITGAGTLVTNINGTCTAGGGDDQNAAIILAHPNSESLMISGVDIDSILKAHQYSAHTNSWNTTALTVTTTLTTFSNNQNANRANEDFAFVWDTYSPWMMNWRLYSDETSETPNTGIAAVNVGGSADHQESIRLRAQVAEVSGTKSTDGRIVLQYSIDPPSSPSSVWFTAGPATSSTPHWVASPQSCGGAGCADNVVLAATSLPVTIDLPSMKGAYAALYSATSAALTSAFDVSATSVTEFDFLIKSSTSAIPGKTYYFRMYDTYGASPITPYMPFATNACGDGTTSAACSFPSVTINGTDGQIARGLAQCTLVPSSSRAAFLLEVIGEYNYLMVAVGRDVTTDDVIAIYANGIAMTRVGMATDSTGSRQHLYELKDSPRGNILIEAIFTASANNRICAVSYRNTNLPINSEASQVTDYGGSPLSNFNLPVTTSSVNAWVAGMIVNTNSTFIAGTNTYHIANSGIMGLGDSNGGYYTPGAQNLNYTDGATARFSGIAVAIWPQPAGATPTPSPTPGAAGGYTNQVPNVLWW